jgi:hypothetical protein
MNIERKLRSVIGAFFANSDHNATNPPSPVHC